jgi:hypothetical protein
MAWPKGKKRPGAFGQKKETPMEQTTVEKAGLGVPHEAPIQIPAKLDPMSDIVRVTFYNLDPSMAIPETRDHFQLEFTYNGHRFKLCHDKQYDLPRCVVEHLNGKTGTCIYPIYSTKKDEFGQPYPEQTGQEKRFRCVIEG